MRNGCRAIAPDIIHSVLNPIDRLTGAIHVYGGDFFGAERSEWDFVDAFGASFRW
jgi:predicted metal-dependent enzyme (double-stranded beta helix superfamily)